MYASRPAYDRSDPDYQRYSAAFADLSKALRRRIATKDDYIDLSNLNNGQWETACLFGGYTKPLETMTALNAKIDENDRVRWSKATRGFRLAPVEEFEMAIAFIDANANARFIHFENGIGSQGQHFEKCISKPAVRVFLADDDR